MPARPEPRSLRIALLSYRGNPHSGGQGVYTRWLARELTDLGHRVEVFSGQPYPSLDPDIPFTPVPSLDLYRPENPFRIPWPSCRSPSPGPPLLAAPIPAISSR